MPQKKNPDVPELARGKTGRMYGDLMSLLTLMKGQPLAYNKDNQEDKEPLFDAVDTLTDTLAIFASMLAGLTVNAPRMLEALRQGHATATDLADWLVKRGMPFRDAHEAVARAVRAADQHGCELAALPPEVLREFAGDAYAEIQAVLQAAGSAASRDLRGGTAPAQVRAQVARADSIIAARLAGVSRLIRPSAPLR